MVTCVGVQCVIAVFPDHTHILFLYYSIDGLVAKSQILISIAHQG